MRTGERHIAVLIRQRELPELIFHITKLMAARSTKAIQSYFLTTEMIVCKNSILNGRTFIKELRAFRSNMGLMFLRTLRPRTKGNTLLFPIHVLELAESPVLLIIHLCMLVNTVSSLDKLEPEYPRNKIEVVSFQTLIDTLFEQCPGSRHLVPRLPRPPRNETVLLPHEGPVRRHLQTN